MISDLNLLIGTTIVVVMLYMCYNYYYCSTYNTSNVKSRSDGKYYKIHNHHSQKQFAADTLGYLNSKINQLKLYMKNNMSRYTPEQKNATQRILDLYNPDNLVENSPLSKYTSYVVDKGEKIAICLREVEKASNAGEESYVVHGYNVLTFVVYHEIAHISIPDKGHPLKFWQAFKFILQEAQKGGIFVSKDYEKYPIHYCGMYLDYNPIYDKTLTVLR